MDKEKELPKRKDIRLKNYDYSSHGAYFASLDELHSTNDIAFVDCNIF